jgi:4-oxalocrotonate tautomerase family enzyme
VWDVPLYRVSAPAGSLTVEQKRQLSSAFTDIHCECTSGTPRKFVHVIFEDVADGNAWTGGEPSSVTKVVGLIRSGRTRETRQQLVIRFTELMHRTTGLDHADIVVTLQEVRAEDSMEWGEFLPEDGHEAGWVAQHDLEHLGVHATK